MAQPRGQRGSTPSAADTIVQPGKNCWRVERADRFYCVQDAADYFRLVRQALLAARHTVFILGWDIFAEVDLLPGAAASDAPTRLDDLLAFVARRRPRLRCYILIWDYAALYTLERDPFSRWKLGWRMPRRVRFGFDDRIPVGGSHHQKIVVVDDQLAFCGGIDLTGHRWDTSAHRVEEPAADVGRRALRAVSRGPGHGHGTNGRGPWRAGTRSLARNGREAAAAVGTVQRGSLALGRQARSHGRQRRDCPTMPEFETQPAVRECEELFLDSIARAKQSIYIESQYFTNDTLAEALAARLREPDGPEIIVVSPKECHGWLEQNTMGAFRNRVFRRMIAADTHRRLRLVYPAASRAQNVPTFIHSKVMVVDDELVRIGSANFSRRSMGVDSECDLAVEARGDPRVQRAFVTSAIGCLRSTSVCDPEAVARGIASERDHFGRFIDSREHGDRTLVRIELPAATEEPPSEALRAAADPDEPILSGSLVADVVPPVNAITGRRPHVIALRREPLLVRRRWMAIAAGICVRRASWRNLSHCSDHWSWPLSVTLPAAGLDRRDCRGG